MEWISAHEWLRRYAAHEEKELDKRRGIETLMQQVQTPEGRPQ